MIDPDRLRRLRGHFHTGEIPIARPDCLNDDTIAALAEGTLGGEARARALIHMATCVFCRHSVASLTSALADGPITHEIEVVEGRSHPRRRVLWAAAPLAAAAVLVVLLARDTTDQAGLPVLRDSVVSDSAAHAPVPIAPRDRVPQVDRFVWSSITGVGPYRLRLYDEEGTVLWTAESLDTIIAAPARPVLEPNTPYVWMVQRQTEWRRWTASPLVEFRIGDAQR